MHVFFLASFFLFFSSSPTLRCLPSFFLSCSASSRSFTLFMYCYCYFCFLFASSFLFFLLCDFFLFDVFCKSSLFLSLFLPLLPCSVLAFRGRKETRRSLSLCFHVISLYCCRRSFCWPAVVVRLCPAIRCPLVCPAIFVSRLCVCPARPVALPPFSGRCPAISVVVVSIGSSPSLSIAFVGRPSLSPFCPSSGCRCPAPSPSGCRRCRPITSLSLSLAVVVSVRHCRPSVRPRPALSVCVSDSVPSVYLIRSLLSFWPSGHYSVVRSVVSASTPFRPSAVRQFLSLFGMVSSFRLLSSRF